MKYYLIEFFHLPEVEDDRNEFLKLIEKKNVNGKFCI